MKQEAQRSVAGKLILKQALSATSMGTSMGEN